MSYVDRHRIQGKTRMATGAFVSPFYLVLGGPVAGTLWVPQSLVVVSNDDFTVPPGAPFFTTSVGQGGPTSGMIYVGGILLGSRSVPGSVNFAALNTDLKMHAGDNMWLRIGGAPAAGTPFTAVLQYQEIIPAGAEELNTL